MPSRATATPAASHAPAHTPMAYARVIAQAFEARGMDPAPSLRLAQITPSQLAQPQGRITARQMELLSGAAMQALDDEALGAFRRRLPWGSYGMLARASLTSPELGLALRRWCRHHGLLTDDVRLQLQVEDDVAIIGIEESVAHRQLLPDARELSLVHLLRNLHGLSCWYVDSRIPIRSTSFPFPAPAHAAAFVHMFSGAVAFGAVHAAMRFDARYLALPLRRDERALGQMLQRALPLTVVQYRRDRLLVQQVRQLLQAQAERPHSAPALAQTLNVSARTLHRQLREEGASLQQLKDEVRCEEAKALLWRSSRPVKQIAAAVGFRNEKSFIRAFRGWTGTTPAEFRSGSGSGGR